MLFTTNGLALYVCVQLLFLFPVAFGEDTGHGSPLSAAFGDTGHGSPFICRIKKPRQKTGLY
jgi:hypothetical protein